MNKSIRKITIEGFKSIRSLQDFELNDLNILIGANGAGKSNFVDFFRMLREMVYGRMQFTVRQKGGADRHLFMGAKVTSSVRGRLVFGDGEYGFRLALTVNDTFIYDDENIDFVNYEMVGLLGSGHEESALPGIFGNGSYQQIASNIWQAIGNWTIYHFHDTSETSNMRRQHTVRDHERLRSDAANLAAFLWRLKQEETAVYDLIRDTVRLVTPFFDDFLLRPQKSNGDEFILLEWLQKDSDYPFHPSQLSDGTLRFIALTTALLQPNPPATILLDEPELGLHPYALEVLAGLINQAVARSQPALPPKTQLVISTQSVTLLNAFAPQDVIVVDRMEGESRFRRLEEDELTIWLNEEYTIGELWQKNVLGGGPAYE